MINKTDIKALIKERPENEGFSITDNEEMYLVYKRAMDRLSDEFESWTSTHEQTKDGWGHQGDSPMYNSGYHFANKTFIASSYDWDFDDPTDLNFYHFESGIDISWYKNAWRGPYGHSKDTLQALQDEKFFNDIINECIESLRNTYENEMIWE